MKQGQDIDVRRIGTEHWLRCRVEIITDIGTPMMVSAPEGLPLCALDPDTGRQMLFLLREAGAYRDVFSERQYELRAPREMPNGEEIYI